MSQSGQPAPAFVAAPASVPTAGVPRTSEPLPRPNPFGRHTLGRQLVVRVTALVALAALLITTATALAARQLLRSQLDGQLDTVTARLRDPAGAWPIGGPDTGLLRPGQPIGTLAVLYDSDGTAQAGGRLTERGAAGQSGAAVTALPQAAVDQLADVPADGTKSSIALSGLGDYRVVGYRIGSSLVAPTSAHWSSAYRCMRSTRRSSNLSASRRCCLCLRSWGPFSRPAPSSSAVSGP